MSDEQLKKMVSQLPLFAGLDDETLYQLTERLQQIELAKGDVLFYRGDPGTSLYIIRTGYVKIVVYDDNNNEVVLNQIGPRQTIGEMAVIKGEPRSATVIAISDVSLLMLESEDFEALLDYNPALARSMLNDLSDRLAFANTYIEQAIEWSKHISEGNYDPVMQHLEVEQQSILGSGLSDVARSSMLLAAFFRMVEGVRQRENELKDEFQRLVIEIDEAKVDEEFLRITESESFLAMKAKAEQFRLELGG